jgi:diguanylate cyclase (GGDEF)-like protein
MGGETYMRTIMHVGSFIWMMTLVAMLAVRFNRVHRAADRLNIELTEKNQELRKSNMALSMLTADLERRVQERTEELRQKNQQLDAERRRVEEVNTELMRANVRLDEAARTDPLTGLSNRRDMVERLVALANNATRTGVGYCVLLADLDHFKVINDTLGHQAGDVALLQVATIMRRTLRGNDFACRWGGEEFLIALPGTPLAGGELVAEKLRRAVADTPLQLGEGTSRLTLSVGVTEADGSQPLRVSLALVDQLMYSAKRDGRNRVVSSRTINPPTPSVAV